MLTSLLARIASLWKRNGENTKLPPTIVPENCQQSLQMSTKAKILSFPAAEAQLNARIPNQLDVFESGGYIFLREPGAVEDRSLHSIEAAVLKFWRVRAW
jgi:hypothetical protein